MINHLLEAAASSDYDDEFELQRSRPLLSEAECEMHPLGMHPSGVTVKHYKMLRNGQTWQGLPSFELVRAVPLLLQQDQYPISSCLYPIFLNSLPSNTARGHD